MNEDILATNSIFNFSLQEFQKLFFHVQSFGIEMSDIENFAIALTHFCETVCLFEPEI
jgi:hypothetical protein